MQENLKSPSAHVRGTVVTALKYTISDQPQPIDSLLHECIADFLSTIGDPDLVRKGLKLTTPSEKRVLSDSVGEDLNFQHPKG